MASMEGKDEKDNVVAWEETGKTVKQFAVAEEENLRYRPWNEDRWSYKDGFDTESTTSAFGVYDGHQGCGIADILKKEIINNLDNDLKEGDLSDMKKWFGKTFQRTEADIDRSTYPEVGSCCSVLMVREEDGKKVLYAANVGDSTIYIVKGKKSEKISYDHKADDDDEYDRIEEFGGEMFSMSGPE